MTIWFLSEEFLTLTVTDKIVVVAGFVLMILLVTLWARWISQRHDAKKRPIITPSLLKEETTKENAKHKAD